MTVLEVKSLEVRYGGRAVVRDVSFAVAAGEIFGLLGPNGAGKTTTLAAVEGLARPARGQAHVVGLDPAREPRQVRACLGVQLQATAFGPDLSVVELVELYAALYGLPCTRAEVRRWLDDAGLGEEFGRTADKLSGGQRQRLALLLATLHRPPVVLLDEPTVGLDAQARRDLWEHVRALRARGTGVVLTTHAMEEAAALADRIGILVRGRLVAQDTPAALVARYADDPRVARLAHGPHGSPDLEDVFLALASSDGGCES